ncbi:MAG: hypothetical protein ACXVFN_05095 [Solirubrobacteraceae bacterium]
MAANKRAAQAKSAAEDAWANPYVQRVIEDAELRDNVRLAFENARSAYGRISSGKSASKLVDDKKLQKDLKQSAEALRDAAQALKEGKKRKRRGGLGKLLIVAIIGAGLAIALSEDVRNKVLDALFGSEEEFDYSSTTAPPPPPAPAPAPAPAATGGSTDGPGT